MKKKLISFFKKNKSRLFKLKELQKKLSINSDHEYSSLKATVHLLYKEGFLEKAGKKYKLATKSLQNKITGTLQINKAGYGFVVPDQNIGGDVFIAARNMSTAFGGDTVEVVLFAQQKGKNIEGQIIDIINRKRKEIVGVLKKSKSFYFVEPDDMQVHRDIYINKSKLNGAKEGDKVIVSNICWDAPELNPEGEITNILGPAGSKESEVISLSIEFGFPVKFPKKVLQEAEAIPFEIPEWEIKNRLDLRDKVVFTIDPDDAKDFDDALSIERLNNGNYSVGIHIADVSYYVKENSELDKHALTRGNSIYLVDSVVPMLPEKISNKICSLVEAEDRLTYSVLVELNHKGRVINYDIRKTIINSKKRFTYDQAQKIILGEEGDYKNEILMLNELARTLRKKRMKEGSIEFSTPEIKIRMDENRKPVEIIKKELKESNMLVEEFMLLANKIIAQAVAAPKDGNVKPFIYRVHDVPDSEKLQEFSTFVKSLGYTFDSKSNSKVSQFQLLMNQIKGKEEESLINELAIRSMAKAVYSPKNIGHYGLGFKYYTHFTSPIRRYADLIVHRLLFQYLDSKAGKHYSLDELQKISDYISQCERNAVDAERLSVKMKQIEYLSNKIGEEFKAIISGVTHFGIFVKLTDILAEGLVKVRDLEGDFYIFDEKKYALIGRSTKKQYRLGDKIFVQLIRVDIEKSEVDFIIKE